eukprot:438066_1
MGNKATHNKHTHNKQTYNDPKLKDDSFILSYSQLINMGFSEELSLVAAQKYPNTVDKAISWITKHSNKSDATHEEKSSNSHTPKHSQCDDCVVHNCLSLKRMQKLLQLYHEWLYYKQNKKFITCILSNSLDNYSMKNILNDYHHIKQKRYNISLTNKACPKLSACIPLQRHKRDNNLNYKQQYFGTNATEIVTQRMLDQMHLYMYHDLTRRNTDINSTKVAGNQSRFGTVVHKQLKNNERNEENNATNDFKDFENDNDNLESDSYNFGQQFFYWEYYKNHKWFIRPKYDNFKHELTTNTIYSINAFSWMIEWENAKDKLENDELVRNLRSNHEFHAKYKIKPDKPVTMNHLMAILFYCNTTELQSKFSSTYRQLTHVMETQDDFKRRHSHYFYFGKYLREIVEVFGDVLVEDDIIFYHGINHPLYFTKMIAKFYCPTSTSKKFGVAANFAGTDGMVLSFTKYFRNAFYFDCILSGFDQEEECLFIGGYAALRISNIVHFINCREKVENYSKYLKLMEIFINLVTNNNSDQHNQFIQQPD